MSQYITKAIIFLIPLSVQCETCLNTRASPQMVFDLTMQNEYHLNHSFRSVPVNTLHKRNLDLQTYSPTKELRCTGEAFGPTELV